jgi:hypothetical protein
MAGGRRYKLYPVYRVCVKRVPSGSGGVSRAAIEMRQRGVRWGNC